MLLRNTLVLIACVVVGASLNACNKSKNAGTAATSAKVAAEEHSHSGWWCDEHGVPEEVCALCDTTLAAGFKAKGDWCEEHNRPDSQCFICHPEKEAEFAALYEAKYGKQPPKPSADGHDHEHAEEGKKS